MRFALWLVACFFFFLGAGAEAGDLVDMVRDLNALQNRMVMGDAAARDHAAMQFDVIEGAIDAASNESWLEERNVRAAIVFLLAGGASPKLREICDAKLANENLAPLLAASLAYTEGKEGGAPKELLSFDARDFPPVLGGHLALVQGGSLIGQDNPRAIELLDLARLLMPGSLVEEAALRREIAILDPVQDRSKLALLSTRYATKYLSSPFAANFWGAIRSVTVSEATSAANLQQLDPVLQKAPIAERLSLYLVFARRAMLAGDLALAKKNIEKAETSAADPAARHRVAAYRLMLAALTDDKEVDGLRKLDRSALDAEDAGLAGVVSGVMSRLTPSHAAAEQSEARAPEDAPSEMTVAARAALEQSDELLKRASRQ